MKTIRLSVKKNIRIFFALAMVFVLLVSTKAPVADASQDQASVNSVVTLTKLELYANIETMGVAVSGINLPKTAQLIYRKSNDANWSTGHYLMRIDDGRLMGSLFRLSPSTSYDIKVLAGSEEISGSSTTQPDELQFTPKNIIHVNDDAPAGGDGSVTAPFRTIQEGINHASPGTQVLVADGIYREAVTFPASGMAGNWIQVKAEGGSAILDGSESLAGKTWTPHASSEHVWFTKILSTIGYLARDQKRFYQYDTLSGLINSLGHGNVPMKEGWYFDKSTLRLFVRSLDDPSHHTWQLPRNNFAFYASGRDWLWIEGFEVRYYGTLTGGCGICTLNVSHLVIRKNTIHNMQLGIYINWNGTENQGNDTHIEYNEIYDPPVNEWPWNAVKGSSMEGTGIVIRGRTGAIVRGNNIHNFFNGIYTGSSGTLQKENSALAFDADIYNNHIHHISDDALEPEGACINHRFRNNTIDSTFAGVSLAPITKGPVWVLWNSISNYTSRSIKWALYSDGVVLMYHNTSWTNVGNVNGMDLITPVYNAVIRNNIFQSTGYAFAEVPSGSNGIDWNNNNWYTTRGIGGYHFKWGNLNYRTIKALCAVTGLECKGYEDPPGLTNAGSGDFTLLSSSPNIDRGVLIPGINDNFKGNAPDVGAFESSFATDMSPAVLSIKRMDANPSTATNLNFTVTFSKTVTGVDVSAPFNDFGLITSSSITGTFITSITPVSGTTYTVSVNTGSGNGTIRLDVIDNDSIVDADGHPLGGAGAGNGNYTAGEAYTVNKTTGTIVTETFTSTGANDGWILESGESADIGGTLDKLSTTINLGDDAKDRQFRGILSFNTNALPDNAVITSVQLKIRRQGLVGINPFTTHGVLLLEMVRGTFSNDVTLQLNDFSAAGSQGSTQDQVSALTFDWYTSTLSSTNLGFVNKYGVTQFRLFFSKDDNDDLGDDYIKFFSGDSTSANMPQLIVSYYLP